VNVSTHVQDVVALLEAEELNEVVLVGHSYGGIVITGVAARAKARLRQLVYLDSAIVEDGQSWASIGLPEVVAERRKSAQESSGGVSLPVPKAEVFGLREPADIAWVQRRMTPQPFGGYDEVMRWGEPVGNGIPKVYVDCTDPAYAGLAAMKDRYRGKPGWPFVELRTGHDAMVSAPEETARLLLKYS
jgi:pimeloyl-ACP methyl ester carboxylesterase